MKIVDDRTEEQKITHNWFIIGTDRYLSGWGEAKGGYSYAVWACRPKDRAKVRQWVENRGDMKRIREAFGKYRPNPRYCAHCHIYVVTEEHPAL